MQRLNPAIAGKFRDCDVWVGRDYRPYISESYFVSGLHAVLCNMEPSFVAVDSVEDRIKGTHALFEHLHPFVDGNGRVGRILYNIHRLNLGLPIHIIHVGAEQREYYKWFDNEGSISGINL
jgi:fido (protein-threonine AMPylation protein)